jgi:hypothetical protein
MVPAFITITICWHRYCFPSNPEPNSGELVTAHQKYLLPETVAIALKMFNVGNAC